MPRAPRMTTYRVSAAVRDMHRVVSLLRKQKRRAPRILWPVALAEEDGSALLAALGTHVAGGYVCAGPLVLRDDLARRAPVITYRLLELYDRTMGEAGIQHYYFYAAEQLSQWQYFLDRLGVEALTVPDEPGRWYRRVPGPFGQVVDSSHAVPVDGFRQRLLHGVGDEATR